MRNAIDLLLPNRGDLFTMTHNDDTQVFAERLVAQNMLMQFLTGQIVLSAPDRGAAFYETPILGRRTIHSNLIMTEIEQLDAVKTLEDVLDTIDQIGAGAGRFD